jgi:REP element-mobilizing transposase RayT
MSGKPSHINKPHNKTLFIYHLVCPVKYRRDVFTDAVSQTLKTVCLEFGPAYDIEFLEIGIDEDHVHFLIQTIPNIRFSDLVKKIKSITAKHIFTKHKEVKHKLWGGHFWTQGYYANTVGNANMSIISNYVKNQGIPQYSQLHSAPVQINLFTT